MAKPTFTYYELDRELWEEAGKRLYGADKHQWRFQCPVCGHIQNPMDFYPYREKGATPNSATNECTGRYTGAKSGFSGTVSPCDFAAYGLFKFGWTVTGIENDKVIRYHVFPFAEPLPADLVERIEQSQTRKATA